MKSCLLALPVLIAILAAGPVKAGSGVTYVIDPQNVLTGDLHIKPGEALEKNLLIKNGNLLVEGYLVGNCIITEGGSVTVKKSGSARGILSYGGPVSVGGRASRISSYKGPVLVSGQVTSIDAIETEVTLGSSAIVTGRVRVTSSKVITAPGAKIKRPVEELKPPATYFPDYNVHKITTNTETVPGFAAALGLLLLVPALFIRRGVAGSSLMLHENFWKSAGAGLAACGAITLIICLGLAYPVFFPLALPALGVGLPALVIGCSSFCKMLGDKIFSALGKAGPEPLFAIITGYAALIALGAVITGLMILLHLAWIIPGTLNSALGHISDVTALLAVTSGIIGTGALARITPSPFRRE